jgi:hypothetical protein
MSATHLSPQPTVLPTVRQLIGELAATEDDLRAMRATGSTDRRLALARRQARILRELRRRHGATH